MLSNGDEIIQLANLINKLAKKIKFDGYCENDKIRYILYKMHVGQIVTQTTYDEFSESIKEARRINKFIDILPKVLNQSFEIILKDDGSMLIKKCIKFNVNSKILVWV